MVLKPQDVLVALNLCLPGAKGLSYAEKAKVLGMSASEVHAAEKRLCEARLVQLDSKEVRRGPLLEFLIHGVPYVFATSPKEWTRGMPTAWAAPALADKFAQTDQPTPIWPDPEGTVQGVAVEPLYRSVANVAKKDSELYDLLSLVDALRIGRMREKKLAEDEIRKRLKEYAGS
ncbi:MULTISPECIES: hypothetical protein [unclassified Lentimonas]|uniref:hypothetical protein n=1 Tax=unclassified Lentimonas TaxID=2630993 RepID=UPI001389DA2D|nr:MULTISPECIES: hypothetical protein [unclassified Lentimonas]